MSKPVGVSEGWLRYFGTLCASDPAIVKHELFLKLTYYAGVVDTMRAIMRQTDEEMNPQEMVAVLDQIDKDISEARQDIAR